MALANKKIPERRVNSTPDECVNCASVLMTDTYLDAEKLQKVSTARHPYTKLHLSRPANEATGTCAMNIADGRMQ
jgi:hypothetical protein